jgi:ATP-dependent protease ClpP protease subunit
MRRELFHAMLAIGDIDQMVLELILRGPIGAGKSISASRIRSQLEAAAGSYNAIHVTIVDSDGGDFREASEIFSLLRDQPLPVAATAKRHCYSGALLIFMAAGLRRATAHAEFLIHPTSQSREALPERVTAEVLLKQADEIGKIDERVVDLFADRTGYDREFFEREKSTEEILDTVMAIESGVVHELEGSTPRCDPAWPETVKRLEKETGCIFPAWMTTAAYLEACRVSAFFDVRKAERGGVVPPGAMEVQGDNVTLNVPPNTPPRLTVIAS